MVDLMEADKRRISAEQHSKIVGLACACRMLGELCLLTGGRNSKYWPDRLAEIGDTFVGRHNSSASEVRTDAFLALLLDVSPRHEPKPNLHEILNEWLPNVRMVISTFNSFQAGIVYRGAHHDLQEFLVKIAFHFNRRFREPQLPERLLQNTDVIN